MIPKEVPVFTEDDMLVSETEFQKGDKATILGWLQRLFLDNEPICNQDIKDYNIARDALSKIAAEKEVINLVNWENTLNPTKASRILNKTLNELGYNE